jgi:hypothetical protein
MNYTEDTLIQQMIAQNLERQTGWESVYSCNKYFELGCLLGRASDLDVAV